MQSPINELCINPSPSGGIINIWIYLIKYKLIFKTNDTTEL